MPDERVVFRPSRPTRTLLGRAATRAHRTTPAQVEWYVEEGLRRDGYLNDPVPADPKEPT